LAQASFNGGVVAVPQPPVLARPGLVMAMADGGCKAGALRLVRIPEGWEGLSIKETGGGRLVVSEVPMACFSSPAFAARGARPQVEGVGVGDEVVTVNGETPSRLAERIACPGDELNACAIARPPHAPGTVGKFDEPPCVSCDFLRRKRSHGLDVALPFWVRAVKRDIAITFGVRPSVSEGNATATGGQEEPVGVTAATMSCASSTAATASEPPGSSVGALHELRSLDDFVRGARRPKAKAILTKRLTDNTPNKPHSPGHEDVAAPPVETQSQVPTELTAEAVRALLKEVSMLPAPGHYLRFLDWDIEKMTSIGGRGEEESCPEAAGSVGQAKVQTTLLPPHRTRPRPWAASVPNPPDQDHAVQSIRLRPRKRPPPTGSEASSMKIGKANEVDNVVGDFRTSLDNVVSALKTTSATKSSKDTSGSVQRSSAASTGSTTRSSRVASRADSTAVVVETHSEAGTPEVSNMLRERRRRAHSMQGAVQHTSVGVERTDEVQVGRRGRVSPPWRGVPCHGDGYARKQPARSAYARSAEHSDITPRRSGSVADIESPPARKCVSGYAVGSQKPRPCYNRRMGARYLSTSRDRGG